MREENDQPITEDYLQGKGFIKEKEGLFKLYGEKELILSIGNGYLDIYLKVPQYHPRTIYDNEYESQFETNPFGAVCGFARLSSIRDFENELERMGVSIIKTFC